MTRRAKPLLLTATFIVGVGGLAVALAKEDTASSAVVGPGTVITVDGHQATIATISSDEDVPAMGVQFAAPPGNTMPTVTPVAAFTTTISTEAPSQYTKATMVLGVFTNTQATNGSPRLVWRIEYDGVCVPSYGPPGSGDSNGCAATTEYTVVDATTGADLGVYSY